MVIILNGLDNINTPYTYITEAKEYLSKIGKEKGRYVPKNLF